ncbi:hypothetical protein BDZ94DRAFT_1243392 [Collybia nuda]|uniref:Uncharacterized protein n=1 Tax=Collybia nuda TaxID=64659 RepID=A0A9P5YJP3_9AGAR|nr:hypothetical protein BDZ94DRAFT_1243392 [Collybia nuda]
MRFITWIASHYRPAALYSHTPTSCLYTVLLSSILCQLPVFQLFHISLQFLSYHTYLFRHVRFVIPTSLPK